MSDLTASNCGCNNNGISPINENGGISNWIWLLILLSACGGSDNGIGLANIFGNGNGNGNSSCCSLIWLLLILSCCCNN